MFHFHIAKLNSFKMTSEGEMKEKLWSCTFWYESDYVAPLVLLVFLIDPILDTWWVWIPWIGKPIGFILLYAWVFCISIFALFNHSTWRNRRKQNYKIALPARAILVKLLEHSNLCSTLYTWLDSILGVKFSVRLEAKYQRCIDTCSIIIWLLLTLWLMLL